MSGGCSPRVRSICTTLNADPRYQECPVSDKFQAILDALPEKPPRSRLEPYSALIDELRRRRRTYREIVSILAEKCDLQVSISTIHDFVRAKSKEAREAGKLLRT